MKTTEKQLINARNDFEKAEKRVERMEKKLVKQTAFAKQYGMAIDFTKWCEVRDTANNEQRFAYGEYYDAIYDLKEANRLLERSEKNLNKIEAEYSKQENKVEEENNLIKEYAIPALETFLDNWEIASIEYYKNKEQFTETTERDIKEEKRRKKLFIIYKVKEKIGKVTDTGNLYIGNDGNINGRIIGEKGTCYLETILAGGYNIQCLHYRVLIK